MSVSKTTGSGLAAAALAAALAALLPSAAVACSCAPQTTAKLIQRNEVIFVGRAVSTERISRFQSVTTFSVSETLKGGKAATRRIHHTAGNGANCGVTFKPGKRVLVLAFSSEDGLSTNLCNLPRAPEADFRSKLKKR